MAETDTKQDAPAAGDERVPQEDTPSEEARAAQSHAVPSTLAGKATATEEEIAGRAQDTITDDDGRYLEPPD
ncbi:hypothetical protein [Archangium sp.]|jgi:hypothetical protein|uniref:hypothetical protein n=1 Tax=Archangium sp. TaxID=1872627 RepID=UPI002EDB3B07